MKVEISEEGIVFCDKLTCDAWMKPNIACGNCPIVSIARHIMQDNPYLVFEYL